MVRVRNQQRTSFYFELLLSKKDKSLGISFPVHKTRRNNINRDEYGVRTRSSRIQPVNIYFATHFRSNSF